MERPQGSDIAVAFAGGSVDAELLLAALDAGHFATLTDAQRTTARDAASFVLETIRDAIDRAGTTGHQVSAELNYALGSGDQSSLTIPPDAGLPADVVNAAKIGFDTAVNAIAIKSRDLRDTRPTRRLVRTRIPGVWFTSRGASGRLSVIVNKPTPAVPPA